MPAPNKMTAQKNTFGGFFSATFYSGAVAPSLVGAPLAVAVGSDVLLYSGAGRLDSVLSLQHTAHSGALLPVPFYDAGTPVSGGPIPASGHKVVGFVPFMANPVSGSTLSSGNYLPAFVPLGQPIQVSQPFQSGLCFNSRSGQCGFTVCYTPEVNLM